MFVDPSDVEDGARLDFDLCIVGAGAAGLSVAAQFLDSPLRVALLEGGGLDFDAIPKTFISGLPKGISTFDIGRLRYFGGTTNHWTNYCRRPTAEDFTARDWNPLLVWPIAIEELDPYFPRAAGICGVVDNFDRAAWAEELGEDATRIQSDEILSGATLIGPGVRFAEEFRRPIDRSASVQCFLNSSCVGFEENASEPLVETVTMQGPDGRRFSIAAQTVCFGLWRYRGMRGFC